MKASDKAALRQRVRSAFPGQERRQSESAAICRHVMAWQPYQTAQVVGGYVPLPREADITPLLRDVLASGRCLALPLVEGERRMTFRRVRSLDELIPGVFGVYEPSREAEIIPAEEIKLLLTPLEAVDSSGMRLGKGGGYYDSYLQGCAMMTLGMALSWQIVETVPCDAWDKPLCAVADQNGIHLLMDATNDGKMKGLCNHGEEKDRQGKDQACGEALPDGQPD